MQEIQKALMALADPKIAEHSQRFFKTGKGEYGEGDLFLGIRVPKLRELVRKHKEVTVDEAVELLQSKYHEARLLALLILVARFQQGSEENKKAIYEIYLDNTRQINNWDLVDSSADKIVGGYLLGRERGPLYKLAKSIDLWERRIAIIATFAFIRVNDFDDVLMISKQLINDPQDLIHKAVGWMLREVGKRDQQREERYLKKRYRQMPRTMLRYAIERFPEKLRNSYLNGIV
ncbi:MAG TPA: DNA alkylation repair protein [Ectothiorhodospiraceae bacterium]|nr:DNA alkylation repair protein [Ectothiorhodospiraceae bacterium]